MLSKMYAYSILKLGDLSYLILYCLYITILAGLDDIPSHIKSTMLGCSLMFVPMIYFFL